MFSTLLTIALLAANVVRGEFTLDTPTNQVSTCAPVKFTWTGATGQVNLVLVKSSDPCGDIIEDFGDKDGTSFLWTPSSNISAGSYMLSAEDAANSDAWSGAFDIVSGSCANSTTSSTTSTKTSSSTSTSTSTTGQTAPSTPASGVSTGTGSTGTSSDSGSGGSTNGPLGAAAADPYTGGTSGASGKHLSLPVLAISAIAAAVALL